MLCWQPIEKEKEYLKLIQCMTLDCLFGRGVDTRETFTSNLKEITRQLSKQADSTDGDKRCFIHKCSFTCPACELEKGIHD